VVELAKLRKRGTSADLRRICQSIAIPASSFICVSVDSALISAINWSKLRPPAMFLIGAILNSCAIIPFGKVAPMSDWPMSIWGLLYWPPIVSDVIESAILLSVLNLRLTLASLSKIELGLTVVDAPTIVDPSIIRGLIESALNTRDEKLAVEFWIVAHHAGYRWRIHWAEAHCARGDETASSIGQYWVCHQIMQGVGRLPIWRWLK
jgi:hypothetical protein